MKKILIFLFFLSSLHVVAQDATLDKKAWQKLKGEVEFVKSNSKSKKPKESNKRDAYDDSNRSLALGPLVQIVIIILFILFISGLLYAILSNVSFKKIDAPIETDSDAALTNIEENFTRSNLERWLKHAISQGDYYLILRIRFLMVLKSLENKKLILWKKDKTNWHYIQELGDHHFQSSFKELVFEFDHVWYGEKKYDQSDLTRKIEQFESFQKMIEE